MEESAGYVFSVHQTHAARLGFWSKMAAAIGITQVFIGICCGIFYIVAYTIDAEASIHPIHYIGVGTLTGGVITVSGVFGVTSSKKKTSCVLVTFLVMSVLSALFSMFPMVLGILGATQNEDEPSLMVPICQLVLATVEVIVATWAIGLASQAVCCPNSNILNAPSRLVEAPGITQFVANGDGQHVVVFSSAHHQQPAVMYSVPHPQASYMLQQGIPSTMQCALANGQGHPMNRQVTPPAAQTCRELPSGDSISHKNTSQKSPTEAESDEREKLLDDDKNAPNGVSVSAGDPPDGAFEVEDEEAHLLS